MVQGFANFIPPDVVIRETELETELAHLVGMVGYEQMPVIDQDQLGPYRAMLARIYDADIEKAAQDVYQRDYMTFGFGNWAP